MTSVEQSTKSLIKPTVTTTTRSILVTALVGLAAVFSVILVLLSLVTPVPWWIALLVGPVLAGITVFWLHRGAGMALISSVGGVGSKAVGPEARLVNLVEGLSLNGGIREPEIHIVHDGALNAAALGISGESHILVTTGLIEKLTRIELEGVIAELVARIKSGDAEVATLGSAIYGSLVVGPLAFLTKPLGVWLVNNLYVADRELLSDGSAVLLTRYPPGLLSALQKIRAGTSVVPGSLPAYDPVWFVPPNQSRNGADVIYGDIADVNLRIDVLAEL